MKLARDVRSTRNFSENGYPKIMTSSSRDMLNWSLNWLKWKLISERYAYIIMLVNRYNVKKNDSHNLNSKSYSLYKSEFLLDSFRGCCTCLSFDSRNNNLIQKKYRPSCPSVCTLLTPQSKNCALTVFLHWNIFLHNKKWLIMSWKEFPDFDF